MNTLEIIDKYYGPGKLRDLLLAHSGAVASKALALIDKNQLTDIDREFVYEAAMLHDIGIFRCDARDIFCEGPLPYICHGVEGRKILEAEGFPSHALVCERHTGSGLTVDDIVSQGLPLPHRDMLPLTREERLVCYADKFFSKSADHPTLEKPMDRILASMKRFAPAVLDRFNALRTEFDPSTTPL